MTTDDDLRVELLAVYADLVRVEAEAELGLARRVRADLKAVRVRVGELAGDDVT